MRGNNRASYNRTLPIDSLWSEPLQSFFGAGGLLMSLMKSMQAMMKLEREWNYGWNLGSSLAGAALAVILIVGGILLIRRRKSSLRGLRIWAAGLAVIGIGYVGISMIGLLINSPTAEISHSKFYDTAPPIPPLIEIMLLEKSDEYVSNQGYHLIPFNIQNCYEY
jgi:hypothetical protein